MLATNHLGHMRAIFYVFYVDFFLLLFSYDDGLVLVCVSVWMIRQCAFFLPLVVVSYRQKYVFILLLLFLYGKYFCLNAYVMCRIDNKLWTKSLLCLSKSGMRLIYKLILYVCLFKLFLLLFSL